MYTESNYKKLYITLIAISLVAIIAIANIITISVYKARAFAEFEGIINKTDDVTSVFVCYSNTTGEEFTVIDGERQFTNGQHVRVTVHTSKAGYSLWDVHPVEDKLW